MAALVVLGVSGCSVARPVGDFGRARPSFTHDVAMPAAGNALAGLRGEPVSDFNRTDQEGEMHDRVWRFLVAAHAKDWVFDTSVELQRTRIIPPGKDQHYSIERYYAWLKQTTFQSSTTRYTAVGRHVTADFDTVPATFAAICTVIEIDRQRVIAYAELGSGLPPDTAQHLSARKYENDAFIAWFVRALSYRYASYDFALDSLLVETPHEQSIAVDEALRRLAVYEQRARRGDFCSGQDSNAASGQRVIASRYQHTVPEEVVFPK